MTYQNKLRAVGAVLALLAAVLVVLAPAEPALACERQVGPASYHVDEPALGPHDACVGFYIADPVLGEIGVNGSVNLISPTLYYDYAQAGGTVCGFGNCVLAGAGVGVTSGTGGGVCYLGSAGAYCVP